MITIIITNSQIQHVYQYISVEVSIYSILKYHQILSVLLFVSYLMYCDAYCSSKHLIVATLSSSLIIIDNSDEQRVWASNYGDSDGSFSNKGMGKHWLCLENGMTYENPNPHPRLKVTRTIGFAFRVKKSISGSMAKILGEENMKNDVDGTTERLLDLSDDLNDNFDVLMDHMSFMKARELVHRELHEETFTKVVRWNILEIVVVVIVTFGQVLNVWWILSRRKNTSNYY